MLDKEANKKLDQQIESYLRLLSGFYLNPAATKTLFFITSNSHLSLTWTFDLKASWLL